MRTIHTHEVNEVNSAIKIKVLDEPGPGGANHEYVLEVPGLGFPENTILSFQNGPIKETGVNGITHEALIAVIIDRLEAFQRGPYECDENAQALNYLIHARTALESRTKNRVLRGVEGTHKL